VHFIAAIGAVFDCYACAKKRSSDFWIKIGLEWLPRFLKEPKRLWERNLKSTPIFKAFYPFLLKVEDPPVVWRADLGKKELAADIKAGMSGSWDAGKLKAKGSKADS